MQVMRFAKTAAVMSAFLVTVACESNVKSTSSDVNSQIGSADTAYIDTAMRTDVANLYPAVGKVLPRVCTGWFASKNFFITNNHCVTAQTAKLPEDGLQQYDQGMCNNLTITLDYYANATQGNSSKVYKCKKIHMSNQGHDFAIVEIEGQIDVQPLAIGAAATPGMNVMVIGHPDGRPKAISEYDGANYCQLRDISFPEGKTARDAPEPRYGPKYEHSIEHNCDTLGGSSGSPIIDRSSGAVVALHWDGWASSAWPHADANGTHTANVMIDDPANPGQKIPFSFTHREGNVGIRIQDIRAFVEAAAAADPQYQEAAALFH